MSYYYPEAEVPALRDVSLEVRAGEFIGLIGPTGAGKSTLCLAFSGIVPQFHGGRFFGSVMVAGLDTVTHPISTIARHVGTVFQDPETQLIATSVAGEIAFALENLGLPREEIRARITPALQAVRLGSCERKHPHELSGGQKQRLAIAAALAMQPDLIVLDEPTSQLDPVGEQEVFQVVQAISRERGIAVVLASHAAEAIAEHADRVVLLAGGRIAAVGPPAEIYGDPGRLLQHHLRPPQGVETFERLRRARVFTGPLPVGLAAEVAAIQEVAARRPPLRPALPDQGTRTGQVVLAAQGLRHTYPDGTEALRGVSLEVRQGEYVALLGQNGAGKSTLVRHFLNLLRPSAGAVQVMGRDAAGLEVSELARRVGYVAQNPDNQIFNATVEDEVAFALRNLAAELGLDRVAIEARVSEALDDLGLLEARRAHPLSLPKGDRTRVVIAAILAMRPEVLILDEPTTGQDYRGAQAILALSRRLHQAGKTVIVVTHHLYLLAGYAERAVVMGQGTVLCDAPLRQALHQTELLRQTYLVPPQAVELAQAIGAGAVLTPAELAACFAPGGTP